MIKNGPRFLSHVIYEKDGTSKTCVVCARDRRIAIDFYKNVLVDKAYEDINGLFGNDDMNDLTIREIDVAQNDEFYRMLQLNNFAVILADEIYMRSMVLYVKGDVIDYDHVITHENREYLDDIYKNMS
tara:strand:- start:663 stop:1046 length:384 start_codon:yes stop_codon:yes gene_type:complete